MGDYPQPHKLTDPEIDFCRMAWNALTSDDPGRLDQVASMDVCPLPNGRNALKGMCRRYPDRASGLTFWDGVLLTSVHSKGPSAARIIGHAMVNDLSDVDFVGDAYLFYRLKRLGGDEMIDSLVKLDGCQDTLRGTTAFLTECGESVLLGRQSALDCMLIDEWIGGVHLSSAANRLWFSANGRLESAES